VWYSGFRHHVFLEQWFPTFFHLHTLWQPISINCTLHLSSTIHRNVQLISQLLTCVLSYTVDECAFFLPLFNFFCMPLNVLFCTPGGMRTPGWESRSRGTCWLHFQDWRIRYRFHIVMIKVRMLWWWFCSPHCTGIFLKIQLRKSGLVWQVWMKSSHVVSVLLLIVCDTVWNKLQNLMNDTLLNVMMILHKF